MYWEVHKNIIISLNNATKIIIYKTVAIEIIYLLKIHDLLSCHFTIFKVKPPKDLFLLAITSLMILRSITDIKYPFPFLSG